jgi:HSP20 family protein
VEKEALAACCHITIIFSQLQNIKQQYFVTMFFNMIISVAIVFAIMVSLAPTAQAWCRVSTSAPGKCTTSSRQNSGERGSRQSWPNGSVMEINIPRVMSTPFEILQFLEDEFDHNFGATTSTTSSYHQMPMDMIEKKTAYEIFIDLPGISKSDLKISVKDNVLTIAAERKVISAAPTETAADAGASTTTQTETAGQEETKKYWKTERRSGPINRSLSLPEDVDVNAISAALTDGVLHLTIQKLPEKIPKEKVISLD